MSTAEHSTPDITQDTSPGALASSQKPQKPQRVLACVLCQQRKVKCDRKFPCVNCIKSKVPCVPTLVPRQRKRRFPEQQLLGRIRKYEDLLRQNNIKFEPLHKDLTVAAVGSDDQQPEHTGIDEPSPSPSTTSKSERIYEVKNIWHAMNHNYRNHNNESESENNAVSESTVKDALHNSFESNDNILFGSQQTIADLSTFHPNPVQIFRLWQIYLDNVNPLLKVTHTPSLQPRIIEAASNVKTIDPNLEALMFGIYCMSIFSLAVDDCESMFGESKETLLLRYQFGCQQAMLKAGYPRTSDRDCLAALYLCLISHRRKIDPRSLHSMLGVAIRIAQRMGLHNESFLAKHTVFEAEMGRRIWWSLILYDTRIGESSDCKTSMLDPTWDCKIPLNVNESDLRPEMKELPMSHGNFSDAIFAVVRSELGEFLRHAAFHLDFTNPALTKMAKELKNSSVPESEELTALERLIEDKYLKFCDPENPLHYITIWTARVNLARFNLMELYWKLIDQAGPRTDEQRDALNFHALKWLHCDSKLLNRRLTKGLLWLADAYFPFPAYLQIISDLKGRPNHEQAERYWEAMTENFTSRWVCRDNEYPRILKIFSDMVFQAWAAREVVLIRKGEPVILPGIVSYLRSKQPKPPQDAAAEPADSAMGAGIDGLSMPMLTDFGNSNMRYYMATQPTMDLYMNQFNWAGTNWSLVGSSTNTSTYQAGSIGPSPASAAQTPWM